MGSSSYRSSSPARTSLSLLLLLILVLTSFPLFVPQPREAAAQIDNNEPTLNVASVVNCIRSGADLGQPSYQSPRFMISCFGSSWTNKSYQQPAGADPFNADPDQVAVMEFGDGKPDQPGEPGHNERVDLQTVGTVYGLAYSSGTHPSDPTGAERVFMSAFNKRLTRFGGAASGSGWGGPGAIYVRDGFGGTTPYVHIPAVIPGPNGLPNNAGDGSAAQIPSAAWSEPIYSPAMGGLHETEHDDNLLHYVSRASLGDMDIDPYERYLYVVNLHNRLVYRIDTWSANPQSTVTTIPAPPAYSNPASCNVSGASGPQDLRPFGLEVHAGYLYLGYVCNAATSQNRADLGAGVFRYNLTSGAWDTAVGFLLNTLDAQRGNSPIGAGDSLAWQPWMDGVSVGDNGLNPQPILADIEIDEWGNMLLGFRDRNADMGGNLWAASFGFQTIGQGDLLRLTPNGTGGWNAPGTGADWIADADASGGGGSALHNENILGGIATVPGTHAGVAGGEVIAGFNTPYRANTAGVGWFDYTGGGRTASEEILNENDKFFGKASGLGDVELLCAWRVIGDRVWNDANGNGVQDSGEATMNGVEVQLLDSTGATVLSTVTTNGTYAFYVEPFRSYRLRINPSEFNAGQPLAGYSLTTPNQGGNDETDSDADQATGQISVGSGYRNEQNFAFDFGVTRGANVRTQKTGPSSGQLGTNVTYTITVTNDGPAQADNVTVRDTLPTGLTYVSASPAPSSVAGQVITWNTGSWANGTQRTYTVVARIDSTGAKTNEACVSTTTPNNNTADDCATTTTYVIFPNLDVAKTCPASGGVGTNVTYTISYRNTGSAAAPTTTVRDTLPSGVTFVSASPAPSSVSGQVLTWNIGTLAAGGSGSITVQVRINDTAPSPQNNQVTVSTSAEDPVPSNNNSSCSTTITQPDVTVTKTGPARVASGNTMQYTLNYRNIGTAAAGGVAIYDDIPAGMTFLSATPAPSSNTGNRYFWSIGYFPAGNSGTITINVRAPSDPAANSVTNNACIGTTSAGNPTGNDCDDYTTIIDKPNIWVTKAAPTVVTVGNQMTYTLNYGNNGASPAANAVVADTLPAGLTFVSSIPAPTSQSGQALIWNVGNLVAGATGSISMVVQTASTLANGDTITNQTCVTTTSSGNDSSDDCSTIITTAQRANVYITKASPTSFPVVSGDPVTYSLDYGNAGPADAETVVIADPMPGQLSGVTWTCTSGCSDSGSGDVAVTIPLLAAGETGRITVTGIATTTADREDFTNTATITTDTPETDSSDNESSVPGAVWTTDMQIIKLAAPEVIAGETFTATLRYRNNGPAPADAVVITDNLPAGTSFVSSNPAAASVSGQTITWNLGTLADAAEGTIDLVIQSDSDLADGSTLQNDSATTTSTTDRNPGNDSSSSTTLVRTESDVWVQKNAPSLVIAGDSISYSLDYGVDGPSTARSVIITDTLPARVTFVSSLPAPTSQSGQTLTWDLGDLTPGTTGQITIEVSTDAGQPEPSIDVVNDVIITSGTPDPDPGDNSSTTTTTVETTDVQIVKTAAPEVIAGETFTATLTYRNNGPADAQSVSITDDLPSDVTFVSSTPAPTSQSGQTLMWDLGTLADGDTGTIDIVMQTMPGEPDGSTLQNDSSITTTTSDRDPTNDTSSSTTLVRTESDVWVQKSAPSLVIAGDTISYSLDYGVDGPSTAWSVIVEDTLPARVTFVSANPAPASQSGQTLTWDLGNVAPGTTGQITIEVSTNPVQPEATLDVVNDVAITSGTPDPDPGDNSSSTTTSIETADVEIIKDMPDFVIPGATFDFTLDITNAGPALAQSVVVSDVLPGEFTLVSASPAPDSQSGQELTWNLGDMAASDATSITITISIPSDIPNETVIPNTGTVTTTTPDRDPTNNTSSDTTIVRPNADVVAIKDGPTGPILSGSLVTYTLTIRNDGPSLAEAIVVTDTFPAGFSYRSSSPEAATNTNLQATWNIGDLDAGERIDITLTGTLVGASGIGRLNTVSAMSIPTDDPDPSNNTDTHTTTVRRGATIGTTVWLDEDGDGYQDAGEPGIANVTVELHDSSGLVASTITDSTGGYAFTNVLPGTYHVEVDETTLPPDLEPAPIITPISDGTNRGTPTPDVTVDFEDSVVSLDVGYTGTVPTNITTDSGEGAIGDLVWLDRNANGVRDDGEPGVGDVTVTLLTDPNADGQYSAEATTQTRPDGFYLFPDLPAGGYRVQIETPSGYTAAWDVDGGDPASTGPLLLEPGDVYLNADFGLRLPEPAVIGDLVWLDRNGDGRQDADEVGLADVTVACVRDSNRNGTWDAGEPVLATDRTDATGGYTCIVPAGDYLVVVTDSEQRTHGLSATTATIHPVSVPAGGSHGDADTGFTFPGQLPQLGSIGDLAYLDRNGNGQHDDGEPGLGDVVIQITTPTGDLRIPTRPDGSYTVGSLTPGNYIVTCPVITGMTLTADGSGTYPITGGDSVTDADCGYTADAGITIGDLVWDDMNGNGSREPEEPAIAGVELRLYRDSDGNGLLNDGEPLLLTTETDAAGRYGFSVPAGDYLVAIPPQAALRGFWHTRGADDTNDASQALPYAVSTTTETADFGFRAMPSAIGDFVWQERTINGVQDADERGLPGVVVQLTVASSNPQLGDAVVATMSDDDGAYSFPLLHLDEQHFGTAPSETPSFTLDFSEPPHYRYTDADQGGNEAQDSDADPASGATTSITVAVGQSDWRWDAGYIVLLPDLVITKDNGVDSVQPGDTLVYEIVIENVGTRDAEGVTLIERPSHGTLSGTGWSARRQDGSYTYAIGQVAAGETITIEATLELSNPLAATELRNEAEVTLTNTPPDPTTPNITTDIDPVIWGSVGDLVWFDADRNGQQNGDDEPGMPYVDLQLMTMPDRTVIAETTTDANGGYRFDHLRMGSYALQIDPEALQREPLNAYDFTTEPIPVTALHASERDDMTLDIGLVTTTPTAVILAYLRAERAPDGVLIRWGTLEERDTDRFEIRRAGTRDGIRAETIGSVPGKGSAGGDYTYLDRVAGTSAYYWLVEIEIDGTETVYGPVQAGSQVTMTGRSFLPFVAAP